MDSEIILIPGIYPCLPEIIGVIDAIGGGIEVIAGYGKIVPAGRQVIQDDISRPGIPVALTIECIDQKSIVIAQHQLVL